MGIGQAHRESILDFILLGQTVLILNIRMGDGMEHKVHGRNTEHGMVHIKSREHGAFEMVPLLLVICSP